MTTAQTVADSNGKAFIGITRDVLAVTLGGQWSQVWEATGFPNQSLAIPSKMGDRQALLASLQAYLTANPTKENAPLGVTAAAAGTLFTALSNARSAVNAGLVDSGQKKVLRDNAETTLRTRMRGTIFSSAMNDGAPNNVFDPSQVELLFVQTSAARLAERGGDVGMATLSTT